MAGFVTRVVFAVFCIATVNAGPQAKFYPAEEKDASNKYIVVLRDGVNQASDSDRLSARLSETFDIQPERQIHIGNFRALIIKTERERVTSLLNEAEIGYIEQDKPVKAIENNSSSCPEYPIDDFGQWGLVRIDSRNAIGLECGTDPCTYTDNNTYSYGDLDNGTDTYVYVFDSGIRVEHEEFGGRAEHGFVASGVDHEGPEDLYGHGTHVAGIAIGSKYGVAKGANAVSVKVLDGTGDGSFISVVEGIEWVVNDIQTNKRKGVCNLSLGARAKHEAMEDAIRSAMSEGIPFVTSAGNDYQDTSYYTPAFLGKDSALITVGATTAHDDLASFSNFGECVNILAPGFDIKAAGISNDAAYVVNDGTSMAAPFVAGVVARLMSREQSSLTPWGIKLWLIEAATEDVIALGSIPETAGTPNKLLYFNCDLPYVEITTPSTTPTTTTTKTSGSATYKIPMVKIAIISVVMATIC